MNVTLAAEHIGHTIERHVLDKVVQHCTQARLNRRSAQRVLRHLRRRACKGQPKGDSSVAINGHQWPSVAISGNQWPSVAISRTC